MSDSRPRGDSSPQVASLLGTRRIGRSERYGALCVEMSRWKRHNLSESISRRMVVTNNYLTKTLYCIHTVELLHSKLTIHSYGFMSPLPFLLGHSAGDGDRLLVRLFVCILEQGFPNFTQLSIRFGQGNFWRTGGC
jgi:hypothetical protein